ncbi:MAG: DUF1405 domain-containing protein [Candidatus Micrarchaeia archaeon]
MNGHEILFWLVFVANLAGAGWGFIYFYGDQLAATPFWLWPFVPDCPLYALLFAIGMLVARTMRGVLADFFLFFTFAGSLKYGFWTVFVLTAFAPWYFAPQTAVMYAVLFVSHVGLFGEALLLLPGLFRVRAWFLPAVLGWFLLHDYSDYFLNTHPPLPHEALGFVLVVTVGMSVAFALAAHAIAKEAKRPALPLLRTKK